MLLAAALAFGFAGAAHAAKDLVVGVPDNLTGLDPADGRGNSLIAPLRSILPMASTENSVNQIAPSEATTTSFGEPAVYGSTTRTSLLGYCSACPKVVSGADALLAR